MIRTRTRFRSSDPSNYRRTPFSTVYGDRERKSSTDVDDEDRTNWTLRPALAQFDEMVSAGIHHFSRLHLYHLKRTSVIYVDIFDIPANIEVFPCSMSLATGLTFHRVRVPLKDAEANNSNEKLSIMMMCCF